MKKNLLIATIIFISFASVAQETITGWSFPANSGPDSLNADLGLTGNKAYDLRFQLELTPTSDSTINTITFVSGATTFAAATAGWDNGADSKFWSIKFKANNYTDFKVSSKQMSSSNGPRDFKLQWRLSSGTYEDVSGGTVTLGSDWVSGSVTDLPVPISGQGTGSIYIRWIMASNNDLTGGTVTPAGQSMIDDILVTAVGSTGEDEIIFTNLFNVFPSPSNGTFTVAARQPLEKITVLDLNGKTLFAMDHPAAIQKISLSNAKPGIYFLKVRFTGSETDHIARFTIE
jgi:hypothetical protein